MEQITTEKRALPYRVYFFGTDIRQAGVEEIVASDDTRAIAVVEQMFMTRPNAAGFTLMGPHARMVTARTARAA